MSFPRLRSRDTNFAPTLINFLSLSLSFTQYWFVLCLLKRLYIKSVFEMYILLLICPLKMCSTLLFSSLLFIFCALNNYGEVVVVGIMGNIYSEAGVGISSSGSRKSGRGATLKFASFYKKHV